MPRRPDEQESSILLDPSTFFKYKGRHLQFWKFWTSAENGRRHAVDGYLWKFIDALAEVDVRGV